MTNLQSTATRLSMFVFHLVFWCLSSKRHFATLTLKFLLNPNTKETMPNLQNTVKLLGIIVLRKCFAADEQSDVLELLMCLLFTVFRWSICAYHVSNILESLLWNFYLTKLRLIRSPVWKILSHASESSFSATPIVLTIRTTLWNSYREIVT